MSRSSKKTPLNVGFKIVEEDPDNIISKFAFLSVSSPRKSSLKTSPKTSPKIIPNTHKKKLNINNDDELMRESDCMGGNSFNSYNYNMCSGFKPSKSKK